MSDDLRLSPRIAAIKVIEPDTAYDLAAIWLNIWPKFTPGAPVDIGATVTMRPYRRLTDGTFDMAPERFGWSRDVNSVIDLATESDPQLAKAVLVILGALNEYLESVLA